MNRLTYTEAEKLLKEIEKALDYWRQRATYIEYGTQSKSVKEPATQLTMTYKGYTIKVMIL